MDSPNDAPQEAEPLQILCPTCGRDSDASDIEFLLTATAILENSEFVLMESVCGACEARLDIAVWPMGGPALVAAAGENVAAMGPEGVPFLDRYLRRVAEYRREWERLAVEERPGPFGQYGIDLTDVRVAPSETRLTTVDSRALAAAQASREVAMQCPGQDPVGMLLVGAFKCAFSLDLASDPSRSQALHLSVSNTLGLGGLRRIEEVFLAGLYFTPEERPFLHEESGHMWPCTHFRYIAP